MKKLREQVEHAAAQMAEKPNLDCDDIVELLVEDGFSDLLASRLNAFVPHAFGRVLLRERHEPSFPSHFLLQYNNGVRVKVRFDREPIMRIATKLARNWMSSREDSFLLVATRSAEVNVAKQVADWDAGPAPIEFCEPVIIGIDPCEYGPHLKPRPWWRFGKE